MKPLCVGAKAIIIDGVLAGFEGKVVGFDSKADEAFVQLDSVTIVETHSENLLQEGETTQLSLDLVFSDPSEVENNKNNDFGSVSEEDWDALGWI